MSSTWPTLAAEIADVIARGGVIPAHPLALDEQRRLSQPHQRALTRYYLDAGASGIAVGVHTTQFAIREHGLYPEVLELAAESAREWSDRPVALIAGVTGLTNQALAEVRLARELGYHAALVNVATWRGRPEAEILAHCRRLGEELPIIGFSLLPECGGFHLSYEFWRAFADIPSVVAIKMAPFNRYRTLEIIRAVVDARAEHRITLYTGNDDHIVMDLVAPFVMRRDGDEVRLRIRGGLLGHWSVWTRRAVELLDRIQQLPDASNIPADLLGMDSIVTECNSAIYDALNDFVGCVPGGLEILRRQGLVPGTWCLNPTEQLGPGQLEAIDRVIAAYPEMNDNDYVGSQLERWMAPAHVTTGRTA
ncbi:dihydrodipicolinate synthase family protein (plasmid) [Glaciihabitans sp. INWT7]|uniref:dihydrodipicolinate synthase family protein n=1 Tax=Glaciihabitans sp. INWT7 TaxID=2596912 RepID=UPI001625E16B|nr:dihydrodipicolinate synthase family protein [Glaciihabitans sp. INWT7]QNE48640.1 dihydrodipicolinate synthase family protein [Glaciihabitans sp. INWT7]